MNLGRFIMGSNGETKMFNGQDWRILIQLLTGGRIYWPGPKSSSADVYFYWVNAILGMQFKMEKVNIKMLITEFLKAKPFEVSGIHFTFLMAGMHIDEDLLKPYVEPSAKQNEELKNETINIIKEDDIVLAVQFNSGYNFHYHSSPLGHLELLNKTYASSFSDAGWIVPQESEILLLTTEGMKRLLTERVFDLLARKNATAFLDPNSSGGFTMDSGVA
eukprot:TRINITY_DN23914_c0_g1_i1.p1 TRINITY_DN23914_c0_g1~~TRINITY_DN23914_c0_g1_i1.p1  ORF type:complete len:218 (-),score=26.48 TRINITY_DN23914_c0_g1_i1:8-661(-)